MAIDIREHGDIDDLVIEDEDFVDFNLDSFTQFRRILDRRIEESIDNGLFVLDACGIPFMDRCRCTIGPISEPPDIEVHAGVGGKPPVVISGAEWIDKAIQEDVWSETRTYVNVDKYPHPCDCGAPAYRGLSIQCSNPGCFHFGGE